jgi:hypothetical protein
MHEDVNVGQDLREVVAVSKEVNVVAWKEFDGLAPEFFLVVLLQSD